MSHSRQFCISLEAEFEMDKMVIDQQQCDSLNMHKSYSLVQRFPGITKPKMHLFAYFLNNFAICILQFTTSSNFDRFH